MEIFRMFGEVALRGGQAMITGLKRVEQTARDVSQTLEQVGNRAGEIGSSIGEGLSLPLAVVGGASLKMAADVGSGQAKIQASLGTTASKAKELQSVATEVWKKGWGENLAEVSDAVAKVTKGLGNLSQSDLSSVTQSALMLSKVFDADVKESTRSASVMMKNFGTSASDTMDLMTYGFQQGGDFADDLLDTLTEYSPQFASMGLRADQFMGILIEGSKAGAFNMDKIGDSMKEFIIEAEKGGKNVSDGFKALGFNASKMNQAIASGGPEAQKAFVATLAALSNVKDKVKQNTIGAQVFGLQWEDVKSKVIGAMEEGVKGIDNFKGSANQAKEAMSTSPYERFQQVIRKMGDSLTPLGNVLIDLADRYGPPFADFLSSIGLLFQSLPTGVQSTIAILGILLIALAPLLMTFGMMATGLSSLLTLFGGFGKILGGSGEQVGRLATILRSIGVASLHALKMGLSNLLIGLRMFGQSLLSLGPTILQFVTGLIPKLVSGFMRFMQVLNLVRVFLFTNPLGLIITAVLAVIAVGVLLYQNWDQVKGWLISAWTTMKNGAVSVFNSLIAFFKQWGSTILVVLSGPIGWIVALVVKHWDKVKSTTIQVWSAIKNSISSVLSGIKSAISNGIQGVYNTVKSFASSFLNAGEALLESLAKGIKSGLSNALQAVKNGMKKIREYLPFSPAKVGPLSDLDESGESFFPTFASRMRNGLKPALSTISDGLNQTQGLLDTKQNSMFNNTSGLREQGTSIQNHINIQLNGNVRSEQDIVQLAKQISEILYRQQQRQARV
ncbi:phage tail tape measure protein [Thermoactinomyces sp. DSM 45892]|uniref:phage tail tape measure protein n=1 Tax=Thermoactinomyces sp. DSM 45892 TaxID=1882753 RepID=UPI00089CBF5B|nr:phage tail tape measure protein [Thermoactinomyces sp. DSM 45892]SDY23345.1 Phage-related minor tail protein [Thermoactinomyces sp. DSM 45892]